MSWIVTWRGFHLNDPGSISLTCREDLQSRFVELQAVLVKYHLNGRTPSPRKPVKSVAYEQKEIHQVWDIQSLSSSSCLKNIYLNHFSSPRTTSSQAFSVNAFRERYCLKPRANRRNIVGQQLPTLLDFACCVRLHSLLHVVAFCWELLCKVWNRSNTPNISFVPGSSKPIFLS